MSAHAPGPGSRVAVCVPAHGAPEGLRSLLRCLDAVDHPDGLLEVVVAVDGPDPSLEAVAHDAGATTVVLPVNRGSYAARNAAVDATHPDTDVVLFTDTDCQPAPQWVAEHLRALEGSDASGGAVDVTTADPPRPAEWVDASRYLRQQHFVERLGFAATCNLAVRREVLHQVRFDETLRSGGDFDFGTRLREHGHRLVYSPAAVVRHPARTTAREVLRKVDRVARGAAEQQTRGHDARLRRDASRVSSLARARGEGLSTTTAWRLRVRALDLACSAVYARRVPAVLGPALRRRLPWAR